MLQASRSVFKNSLRSLNFVWVHNSIRLPVYWDTESFNSYKHYTRRVLILKVVSATSGRADACATSRAARGRTCSLWSWTVGSGPRSCVASLPPPTGAATIGATLEGNASLCVLCYFLDTVPFCPVAESEVSYFGNRLWKMVTRSSVGVTIFGKIFGGKLCSIFWSSSTLHYNLDDWERVNWRRVYSSRWILKSWSPICKEVERFLQP